MSIEQIRKSLNINFLYVVVAFVALALLSLVLFGPVGFLSLAIFFAFFLVPALLLFWRIDLPSEQKIVFSLLCSLGIFPILVWAVNLVMPSFRVSTVIVAVAISLVGIVLKLVKK